MTANRYSWPVKAILAAEALTALVYARLILHRTRPSDILASNQAALRKARPASESGRTRIAKVTYIIHQLATRVPWRADCLVQALAGQRMLQRHGIASTIIVGTTKDMGGIFEAHAWLSCNGKTILGGDIGRFEPLLQSPSRSNQQG